MSLNFKKIKIFFIKYFFLVNDGFVHKKAYSEVSSLKKIKLSFNKFSILFNIRQLIIWIIQIVLFPISIIFYFLNIKIITPNIFSIGSCVEQVECLIKRNELRKKKKKLIFFAPRVFSQNYYLSDLFSKKLIILKNPLHAIYIVPLSQYYYCIESAFIKKNNLCIFPYQYAEFQNAFGEVNQLNFSDNIIIEDLVNFRKKNKKIDFNFFFKDKKLLQIKSKFKLKNNNFYVFHIREEDNHQHRNSDIINYELAINFLAKKGSKVFIISKKKINTEYNEQIHYITNKNQEYDLLQIYLIKYCKCFIGTLSGLCHLAFLFQKDTILLNTVVFNTSSINTNKIINLPKKFFFKNNNKKLNIKDIFNKKIESSWETLDLKRKAIYAIDNSSNDILKMIKFYLNPKKKFIKLNNLDFYSKSRFKKYLIATRIPEWY